MKTLKEILEPTDFDERKEFQKKSSDHAHALGSRLEKHYKYPENEEKVLNRFTYSSSELNNHLWNDHKQKREGYQKNLDDHEEDARIKGVYEPHNLDKALNRHKTPEDMELFSNSRHDPREIMNKDGVVHHPGYMSASINRNVSKNLKWNMKYKGKESHHHIWHMNIKKNSPGAYVNHLSNVPGQYEFVLPSGRNYKYNGTESQQMGNDHYHYHSMELLP